jgi:hypothetical protein
MRFYKLEDMEPPFNVPILVKLDEYWVKDSEDNAWWDSRIFHLKDVPEEYFGKVCPFYYVVTAAFDERRGKIMFTEADGEQYGAWSEDEIQGWAMLKDIWENEEWG